LNFSRVGFVLVACVGLSRSIGVAQSPAPAAAPLAFDVASIHASGPQSQRGSNGGPGSKSPALYRYNAATLQDLIAKAWNVEFFQIASATPVDHDKFDLSARVPEGASQEQFRAMLQNLLAERFGLKEHVESREFLAYALVVAKSGLKLKEEVAGETAAPQGANDSGLCGKSVWPEMQPNHPNISVNASFHDGSQLTCVVAQSEPLPMLARLLPNQDKLPVVDKTGLTGRYSFRLEFAIEMSSAAADSPAIAPDIFTALQQQLGLQLVQKKLPFEVVVVDSFNKTPTEN
jgi:uncharacterized protein (TIGR03435 family)